jgi:hypothetical protein
MATSLLTLGSFSFDGFESPERIVLKSKQRLVIHHLASGYSSADSLGQDCDIVSFQGIFTGTNALTRIRSLEYIRIQGQPVPLIWGSKTLSVIIQSFELSYLSNQWIPYKIACIVDGSRGSQPEIPQDPISSSPDTQVSDILSLLQSTSLNTTSAQITALVELAGLNYDMAPPDALQQAQQLANMVNTQVMALDSYLQAQPLAVAASIDALVSGLAGLTAISGQEASLVLAGNRLMSVIVTAQNIDQQ